ncbi:hypothetical protein E2C01_069040 [Portunus trituberculatus]|uniref:Uncharacterized protein n=1 Tax=Portunus trituberculatus TaxID=210409 RepID=A0A5B7I145_PORTR|nr:hypothetical protein [Portunus trituberculatus]
MEEDKEEEKIRSTTKTLRSKKVLEENCSDACVLQEGDDHAPGATGTCLSEEGHAGHYMLYLVARSSAS